MQPTLAAFNFKSSSNDQDGPSASTLEENIDACRFPTSVDSKKREAFPSSWLSQFDLVGFDEKRGTMHLIFHFNETNGWCLKFLYPHFTFSTPNSTCQGVQIPSQKFQWTHCYIRQKDKQVIQA